MFFTGEASTRKRVDLGGRSSKERDRQKLLEQARFERKRRLDLRQQNSAALRIQKCFRGRKVVHVERTLAREQFCVRFGDRLQHVDRNCFSPDSEFLRLLLFFFNAENSRDFGILVETCRLLRRIASGNLADIFGGPNYAEKYGILKSRIRRFVFACFEAVHQNRVQLKTELLSSCRSSNTSTSLLLEAVVLLISSEAPWACDVINYLFEKKIFMLFREIVLTGREGATSQGISSYGFSLENVSIILASHFGHHPCSCSQGVPWSSFSSQILSVPFLWRQFPLLREVFVARGLTRVYINQLAVVFTVYCSVPSSSISQHLPGHAYLLGNIMEIAGTAFLQPDCTFDMAIDFSTVATFLLEAMPPLKSCSEENLIVDEDEMAIDGSVPPERLCEELEQQILNALDPRFLHHLVSVLFRHSLYLNNANEDLSLDKEVSAVGAICAFLHVLFNIFPVQRIMPVLAYRTKLVPVLWTFMKRCHEKKQWPILSDQTPCLTGDSPGWILPLVVFCPIYRHMLMLLDNEEFYEQEKPLSLMDIRLLIVILRQALWELVWVTPMRSNVFSPALSSNSFMRKRLTINFVEHKVSVAASELLTVLQDWNNRQPFTSSADFHAQDVDEIFITQAVIENTRANEILKKAPFLVPFTGRVKIFTLHLASARQRDARNETFAPQRFRIRRNHIFEDAFDQLNVLSDDELQGLIRVSFINELGVEEAGVDGGGIFKDFMENIVRAAFDIQYGLFKETINHLLYPNPGSGLVHEQHLQYFHFLGCLLGKAMFEGILVDVPFASFFLRALKEKKNLLNDLPSLDQELYRHLIFLKHYEGDLSELELYFVIVNNEYGEQKEEELVPGGKDIRVTNKNVREFIHCVARHRLNYQISPQSKYFLRGFQKLIKKEWMDMFSEHELQLLISGSLEGLDVDDLYTNVHYAGGYSEDHYVIKMFWEVMRNLSAHHQKKFLKFVTGCSRGPLLGFKYLEPQFCIQRTADASGEDLDRLPTSATCMNLLKLPPYRSKEQLEQKLMYAINADAGFDLS